MYLFLYPHHKISFTTESEPMVTPEGQSVKTDLKRQKQSAGFRNVVTLHSISIETIGEIEAIVAIVAIESIEAIEIIGNR